MFFIDYGDVIRALAIISFIYFVKYILTVKRGLYHTQNFRLQATEKLASRDLKRQTLLDILKNDFVVPSKQLHDQIYNLTATQLLEGFKANSFTYSDVIHLFSLRALTIGIKTNAVTEEFYDDAIKKAKELDKEKDLAMYKSDDQLLLLGVPISVKDQIHQQGADSSMGLTARNFRPSHQNGLVLELLIEQGAIPFVRTNTLQAMMLPETDNLTYGRTVNPWDFTRTCGGSSGGEGALLGARGSVLGIGTDVGGSIRIPAHFCGVYGFKPTPGRITDLGIGIPRLKDVIGEGNIRATVGPLGHSTDDLVLVMKSFLKPKMWQKDKSLVKLPWRDETYRDRTEKLRIGYYTTDDWFTASPACVRAVLNAVDALRQLGHTVVEFKPKNMSTAVRLYTSILAADGIKHFLEALEGEKLNNLYTNLFLASRIPTFLRPLLCTILTIIGESRAALIVKSVGARKAYDYIELIREMKLFADHWITDMENHNIDLIISPANGLPAYHHTLSKDLFVSCSYTLIYNLLNFPAGVVPVTVVKDDEQRYSDDFNDSYTKKAASVCQNSKGCPIGVQVAGFPWQDEKVLRIMKELEDKIQFKQLPKLAQDIDIYH
ncbi:unnamed protein product [Didymodactylos carnosus]|uniref:Amidase domain-containing protein n=1 Tax=Didymodactylos carnosus TaxID=1234261 RepID=A0A814B4C9_9BILA|nr:unnamed protein product [Didymodactylos carnosus]CAF3703059.1 unnamed protein product [Didymodactylos carnosus]